MLLKQGFSNEEIAAINEFEEKLGRSGLTPKERVSAFKELKHVSLTAATRFNKEMFFP